MDTSIKNIKLVELANTWQGEGPDTGRQMVIARFKYCNLSCKYCDTQIKMKSSIEGSYSIDDINSALDKTQGLMITGGEPTLAAGEIHNLYATLEMAKYCKYQSLNIETNGCKIEDLLQDIEYPNGTNVKIMYSPKIFTEKMYSSELEKVKKVISHPLVYIKVVADTTELTEKFIKEISKFDFARSKIYLMPLGVSIEEIQKNWEYCINLADECHTNLSTRMHIMNHFT